MGKLILVRHGRTVLNSVDHTERLRGWLDIPLDEEGLQEARETGERVMQFPVEGIYSSDLQRALQTATAISAATKVPVIKTPELRPWNVGSLAGQHVKDILDTLHKLEQDPDFPAPDGESFHQFCDRYAAKLNDLLALAAGTSGCIVAVTHVRNVLATPALLANHDRRTIPVRGGAKTGALVWVEPTNGKWTMRADDPITPPPPADEPIDHLRI